MPSFSISGSSFLTPLLLACSSQSLLVLFPPLIFGPSSSVAEAFSGFFLSLYSQFFVQFSLLFFFSVFGLIFRFLLPKSSPGSRFSSPFYRETCPSTSPAFAGLLFKSRAGSWARDVVHDLLQISC